MGFCFWVFGLVVCSVDLLGFIKCNSTLRVFHFYYFLGVCSLSVLICVLDLLLCLCRWGCLRCLCI